MTSRALTVTLTAGLLLAALSGTAGAQRAPQPRNCIVDIDTAGRAYQTSSPAGGVLWFAGGVFKAHCRGESTRMESDSVEWYSARGELRLLGNVHFRDSTAVLDADKVTYWTRQERLYAEGRVYTRNLSTGSEMRGPNLDYYRAVPPIRDTLDLVGTGRPTIHFFPASDSAKPDSARTPFVIVANRVRLLGTERMWAGGQVTIDRPDLTARADSAFLHLGDSVGFLIGAPVVTGRDTAQGADTSAAYRLTGQRIRFDMAANQQIRHVLSAGDADAAGRDWRLTSDTLDMALDSGRIQRAQAWGRNTRPVAVSGLSTIVADSLDIRMPAQVMELIWAFGDARARSRPESTVVEEDWLTGDTLRAAFVEQRDQRDTTRRRSEIDRVTAFGSARALYHIDNERDPSGERGINYSRGARITIALADRKVRTVDIVGLVDGVYLEPLPPGADTAAEDSASARDSTRGRPAARPAPPPAARPAPGAPARPATTGVRPSETAQTARRRR